MSVVCESSQENNRSKTCIKKRRVNPFHSVSPNCHHSRVGSDVLAHICNFLNDRCVVRWYLTSKTVGSTGFMDKVALKDVYTFRDVDLFPELKSRYGQIRSFCLDAECVGGICDLPPRLVSLHFGVDFIGSFNVIFFPSSLQELVFPDRFNESVAGFVLLSSLVRLTFGESFDQSVAELELPSSLAELRFGYSFNQPVSKLKLPPSLLRLIFGSDFNQAVCELNLPCSLQELTFGDEFNQACM